MVLPGKSNLATDQAAAIPNRLFRGTAMAAAMSDSRKAASASGSMIAVQKAQTPRARASLNTSTSGSNKSTAINEKATAPRTSLSQSGSSVGLRNLLI